MPFDPALADSLVTRTWSDQIVGELTDYIAVPALSPAFDDDWAAAGHLDAVVASAQRWIERQPVAGLTTRVQRLEGRTPLLVCDVPAFGDAADDGTVVLYGHLDKQPEMTGWRAGLGPWTPVLDGDRLYGRGGADDGYAGYASVAALAAVQAAGGSHPRCVVLIETSEESGSPDLPAHVDALGADLGDVRLVICLDSGCATYDRLWLTSSLRGLVGTTFTVGIVHEGLHSGAAGGIVPSTFRIARRLLDRIEDSTSGAVLIPSANVTVPAHRIDEATSVAASLGHRVAESPGLVDGASLASDDPVELLLNKTWRPSLEVIGADGFPTPDRAGNVLRPTTTLAVSIRIPPTADPHAVRTELTQRLTADVPYGAQVVVGEAEAAAGWNSPELAPWLVDALERASVETFGHSFELYGEGGTIPFMGMLGATFPDAQFVITGVLGPESNAHGPNEFLHVPYATTLTRAMARVLASSAAGLS